MLCGTLPEIPAPRLGYQPQGDDVEDQLARAFLTMLLSSRRTLATDGSAQDGVATWAVYIPGVLTAAGEVLGEDTEAFHAEMEAILQALRAAAWASQRAPRHGDNFDHITILYDSLSVVT